MNYRDDISIIGNADARLAELLHQSMKPGGERLLFEAFWDPYPPLRHRAADELADVMSDDLAILVAQVAAGSADAEGEIPAPMTLDVRRAAALALRTDALPPRAHELLLEAFRSTDETVRYHALLSLHRNADAATLRVATAEGLSDVDAGVVVIAAQVAAERHWVDLVPDVLSAFDRLVRTDQFAVAAALSELIRPEDAPEALVDTLLGGLRDEKTIAAACQALARIGARRSIEPLRKAMGSFLAHPLNKLEAAASLVVLGDDGGMAYLEKMLGGRRKDTRGYAIELIAKLGIEKYRPQIEAIARSDDYHTDTAVMALARFGDSRAFELLGQIARTHPDPEIRDLAAETSAVDGSIEH